MSAEVKQFREWAIVDVMGHQRYIGQVSEQVIAGTGFVRVDVPETSKQKPWTKLIGTSSIYTITPVTEEIARHMAESRQTAPVNPYDLPKPVPAIAGPSGDPDGEDYCEDYDEDEHY